MKKYIYTEYVAVKVAVVIGNDEDVEAVDETGSEFVDRLLYNNKSLRALAEAIDKPDCYYIGADSTGDTEVEQVPADKWSPYTPSRVWNSRVTRLLNKVAALEGTNNDAVAELVDEAKNLLND